MYAWINTDHFYNHGVENVDEVDVRYSPSHSMTTARMVASIFMMKGKKLEHSLLVRFSKENQSNAPVVGVSLADMPPS
jgi:hypothetical protein